jgi:hypothetical protein
MNRPDPLTKHEPLIWSTGTGADVWDMFCASIAGDLDAIRKLLCKDPSLVRSHYWYRTPLYFAVRENRTDVAEYLLDHGADPLSLAVNETTRSSISRATAVTSKWKSCWSTSWRLNSAHRPKANPSPRQFAIPI